MYTPLRKLGNFIGHGSTTSHQTQMTTYQKEQLIRPKGAPKKITSAFPTIITSTFPSTLLNQPPKPGPVSAMRRFMGTRAFWVYCLVIIHGVFMSAFELCCQALPPTAGDDQAASGKLGVGEIITVNMMFFTVANLVVIWLFSFVRYFVHGRARLAETFLIVSWIYNALQLPLLGLFIYAVVNISGAHKNKEARPSNLASGKEPIMALILVLGTVFHATVFFWIFTGGPLTFYVSTSILGGHEKIKAFGVPAILFGFAGAMVIPGILTLTGGDIGKTNKPSTVGGDGQAGFNTRRGIIGVCIIGQFFTLLFFKPFDYSWNKNRWFNYFILIMTGVVNTLFLSYTYLSVGLTLGRFTHRMIIYGGFYAVMGLVVSKAMGIMFRSFNADEIKRFCCLNYHYCFPTVYKAITIIFWILNASAFVALLLIYALASGDAAGVGFATKAVSNNYAASL